MASSPTGPLRLLGPDRAGSGRLERQGDQARPKEKDGMAIPHLSPGRATPRLSPGRAPSQSRPRTRTCMPTGPRLCTQGKASRRPGGLLGSLPFLLLSDREAAEPHRERVPPQGQPRSSRAGKLRKEERVCHPLPPKQARPHDDDHARPSVPRPARPTHAHGHGSRRVVWINSKLWSNHALCTGLLASPINYPPPQLQEESVPATTAPGTDTQGPAR